MPGDYGPSSGSHDGGGQDFKGAFRGGLALHEGDHYWLWRPFSFIEKYREVKLCAGVVVRSISANPSADFVAIFQSVPICRDIGAAPGLRSKQGCLVEHGINGQDGSVTIYSTEIIKDAEGASCPSVIRLHHVDDEVCRLITDTPKEIRVSPGKWPLPFLDGEIRVLYELLGSEFGLEHCDREGVQRGAQIVDTIANNPTKFGGVFDSAEAINTCKSIRLIIGKDFVGFIPLAIEIPNRRVKIVKVFLCSV